MAITRVITFILIGQQAVFVIGLITSAATTRSEAAGQGTANAHAMIGGAVFVVLALPALAVAIFTRRQWLALTLSILGILALVALIAM